MICLETRYELLQSDEKPRFLKPLAIPEIWGLEFPIKRQLTFTRKT